MQSVREKLSYALDGLQKRFHQKRVCPSCGSVSGSIVSVKFPYNLYECEDCGLGYRWPTETAQDMKEFYQDDYEQDGLTTDLPTDSELDAMIKDGFGEKDFTRHIDLFRLLGAADGDRVLDFGANWGYGVYQFNRAGFDATGYEISKPRARFGLKLDVGVLTDWQDVSERPPFDIVFSSHVLEHTPNPQTAIKDMLGVLKPGGLFVSVFPNGSSAFRSDDPERFKKLWGKVHPVMLNDVFLKQIFADCPLYLGSLENGNIEEVKAWDQASNGSGTLTGPELLVIARKR